MCRLDRLQLTATREDSLVSWTSLCLVSWRMFGSKLGRDPGRRPPPPNLTASSPRLLLLLSVSSFCFSDSYFPTVASRLSRSSPASVKCSPRLTLQIHSGRSQRRRDEDTWPISPSRNHCSGCCGKTGPDQQEAVSQPMKLNWRVSKKTKCCNKKINKRLKLQSDDRELG